MCESKHNNGVGRIWCADYTLLINAMTVTIIVNIRHGVAVVWTGNWTLAKATLTGPTFKAAR